MYYNPQPIIGSMQDACISYNNAINRVLESWDDKVSESMQTSCIGELAGAGQSAVDTMTTYGTRIADILDEMRYFAYKY